MVVVFKRDAVKKELVGMVGVDMWISGERERRSMQVSQGIHLNFVRSLEQEVARIRIRTRSAVFLDKVLDILRAFWTEEPTKNMSDPGAAGDVMKAGLLCRRIARPEDRGALSSELCYAYRGAIGDFEVGEDAVVVDLGQRPVRQGLLDIGSRTLWIGA